MVRLTLRVNITCLVFTEYVIHFNHQYKLGAFLTQEMQIKL